MGKGKGNPYTWVYNIRNQKFFWNFLCVGIFKKNKFFLKKSSYKLPKKSKFLFQPKALNIRELSFVKKQIGKITPSTFFNRQRI